MRAESGPVSRTEVGTAEGRGLRTTGCCPRGRDAVARRTRLRFRPGCGRSACRRRRALAAPCPAARRPRVDRAVHHVVIFRRNLTAWCHIHARPAMTRGGTGRRAAAVENYGCGCARGGSYRVPIRVRGRRRPRTDGRCGSVRSRCRRGSRGFAGRCGGRSPARRGRAR